jgi:hypothetical protein
MVGGPKSYRLASLLLFKHFWPIVTKAYFFFDQSREISWLFNAGTRIFCQGRRVPARVKALALNFA